MRGEIYAFTHFRPDITISISSVHSRNNCSKKDTVNSHIVPNTRRAVYSENAELKTTTSILTALIRAKSQITANHPASILSCTSPRPVDETLRLQSEHMHLELIIA